MCGNESKHGGSYMAKAQLARIQEAAKEAYHLLGEDEEISDWMESNIAKVEHMIISVYNSLNY